MATGAAVAALLDAIDRTADDITAFYVKTEKEVRRPLTKRTADRLETFVRNHGVQQLMHARCPL